MLIDTTISSEQLFGHVSFRTIQENIKLIKHIFGDSLLTKALHKDLVIF